MSSACSGFRPFRAWLAMAALLLLLGGGGLAALSSPAARADGNANYPQASLTAPADPAALIARGKYLTLAADCMPCHTGPNRAPFSGGLVLNTPFGGLTSPNITPDKATGIGNWTDKQFWNAVHDGIAPGHSYLVFPRYLYPAMPFTSYTKLSYADVMAIKAYLFSLPPVSAPRAANALNFPFNQRPAMLGWRLLFFRPGPMHMKPGWDEAMKNGAYLTEALGHCQECHTPRNLMGAMITDRAFAGSPIDAFYAPNISSDKTYGVGGWPKVDLVAYLHHDGNMTKGSAYGPMQEVVLESLSQIPASDVADMADYLQTQTKPQAPPPAQAMHDLANSRALGKQVYASNCASCHGATGGGISPFIPNLAGNSSVIAAMPYNVLGAVLNGIGPWRAGGPPMPSFAGSLSDAEIAGVANYVRTSWGNKGVPNATPQDVMNLRAVAAVPMNADMMADEMGCPRVSSSGAAGTVADPGNGLLGIFEGTTPDTLPNRARELIAALRSANPKISRTDITNTLVAAYCPVIAHETGMSMSDRHQALENFIANAQPLIDTPLAPSH
ncbi:MAG TPA: cytochrome c [Acidocella sp.]|nr:cytochrome c [Acidocella sp.]